MSRAVDQSSNAQQNAMIDEEAKPAEREQARCCASTHTTTPPAPHLMLLWAGAGGGSCRRPAARESHVASTLAAVEKWNAGRK
jgi:hypothetical protein